MEIIIVSALLLISIVMLVSERVPVDLTALGIMVALMAMGILTPGESMAGFSHPAPLTVAALLIVSQGLLRTGALDFFSRRMVAWSEGRRNAAFLLLLGVTGFFSAFINNTPVVILAIPIALAVCAKHSLSPSKLLIPISFISILAGTSTLIGTSTNIVVSNLGASQGLEPLGMFELSRVGLPIAAVGLVFLYLFSFRLLPSHKEPVLESDPGSRGHYLSELLITMDSQLVGRNADSVVEIYPGLELFEVLRGNTVYDAALGRFELRPGDIMLVKGDAQTLAQVLSEGAAVLPQIDDHEMQSPYDPGSIILELIVLPRSRLVGRRLMHTALGRSADVWMIGVKRQRVHFGRRDIRNLRLSVGDILLVQCPVTSISRLRAEQDLIVVEDVVRRVVNRRRAPVALGIFLTMVAAASMGLVDILVCAMTAAFLMILTGCMKLRDAYGAVDAKVLLLIIGTIALGTALQKTGAANLYSDAVLRVFSDAGPQVVLAVIIILTSVMSHFLSNNSTAVLLVPVALSVAAGLGVDSRPFLVGICFGASACFATPIGYQTNLLVYGAGGYKFTDFLKLGLPLNVMVWVASTLLIPVFWPF